MCILVPRDKSEDLPSRPCANFPIKIASIPLFFIFSMVSNLFLQDELKMFMADIVPKCRRSGY